ncbi:MAG: hypothetical protein K1X72_21850 [Pyrinomonadaceae bacterium]|nr:hypothetical protein [Pyrinomonadaceae bacterium]
MINNGILQRVFSYESRLLLLFVFIFSINSPAQNDQSKPTQSSNLQTPRILFNQIPTELGLSQNVITCSLQDKAGFLWFGTKDGLNRFDGYQFKVYQQNPSDPTSISDSSITTIFEDTKGRMWIGTENGLNLFDRTHETFYRILPDPNNPNSLSHHQILYVAEDKQNAIWIGTTSGLNKLELSNGENPLENARFTIFKRDPAGLENDKVYQVLTDESGTIYAKLDSGNLFTLTPDTEGKNYVIKLLPVKKDDYLINICQGRNNKLWLVGNKGIYGFDLKTQQTVFYPFTPAMLKRSITVVMQIIEDRNGNIWFGGYWGLARFSPQNQKIDYFPSNEKDSKESSLVGYGVNSILEDRSGALWFGSNGKGIWRFDRQAERFAHFQEKTSKFSLWRGDSVRVLFETDDGTLLVGGAGGGVSKFNRETGETTFIKSASKEISDFWGIIYLAQDKDGSLWANGINNFIRFNLKNGIAENVKTYPVEPDSVKLPQNLVQKVFKDRFGNLWFANNVKLFRYNRETDRFENAIVFDEREWQERPYDNYVDIYVDEQNIFWMGTTDGFVRVNPNTGEAKHYRKNAEDKNSLSHNVVRTVAPDPFDPNILWLGTKGGGLNRFDKQTETFSALTEKDGLPNNVIYGILSDDEGNLWLSTNNGISRFNPRTRVFKNFDKKDGLQDNEFNSCAFFKSRSGELFFGGINGFNAFYPADVKDNPNPPRVVLTDFQVLNQPVSFKEKDSPLKQAITDTKEITLNYDQRFFSFEFAALDFTEPSKNQYAYQLEGFDKDLVEVGTRRTAFYTNVTPGTYLFRVIASNNDGVWNREGATIQITILPPFWQTWWFRTLLVLLVIGLIFLIIYPRISKLRYEKEIQEAFAGQLIEEQENDRKRIAAELHDGLGQSLLIIKNRAFLGEKATEKETDPENKIESAREQFGEISGSATEALEQVREIAYYLRPSQLERLGLTSALEEMIERVADSSDIEFDVKIADLDGVFSKQNEINFYRIVQESLNNIIKHSKAKSVKIRIVNDEKNVELVIKDDGQGFAIEAVGEKTRSFGLKGMSERARLLGGTYSIKSSASQGTIVVVKIGK